MDDARDSLPSANATSSTPWRAVRSWFDASATTRAADEATRDRVDWTRILPFVGMHAACLGAFWVGVSPVAVGVAVVLYVLRMFAITGFYHRYFSHRTFKTSRLAQFVFAVLGNTAAQRSALWWAAHHRRHHAVADREGDPHSPHEHGLYWSHMGWITSRRNFATDFDLIPDLARFPELRWLEPFDTVVPVLFAGALYGLGAVLAVQELQEMRRQAASSIVIPERGAGMGPGGLPGGGKIKLP